GSVASRTLRARITCRRALACKPSWAIDWAGAAWGTPGAGGAWAPGIPVAIAISYRRRLRPRRPRTISVNIWLSPFLRAAGCSSGPEAVGSTETVVIIVPDCQQTSDRLARARDRGTRRRVLLGRRRARSRLSGAELSDGRSHTQSGWTGPSRP